MKKSELEEMKDGSDRSVFINTFIDKLKTRNPEIYNEADVYYYPDGYTSDEEFHNRFILHTNVKYHNQESYSLIGDFVCIVLKDFNEQICTLECDYLYDSYQKQGWDIVWKIVDSNIMFAIKMSKTDVKTLLEENNYENLKEKLFIRPLNFNDNRYALKDTVYRRVGDIALVLYFLVMDEYVNGEHNVSSVKIPKNSVENWGISAEEAFDAALVNTNLMAPPRLYLKPEELTEHSYQKGAFMALGSPMTALSALQVPILTTTSYINGAIAIFYAGVKERIADMFGDDYYVVFSSTDDIRLHKKGTISPLQLLKNLKYINQLDEKTLSRKIYLYERVSGNLKQLEL